MTDDVAAVLAESIADTGMILYVGDSPKDDGPTWQAQEALTALTAAGYAVVKLPEGVAARRLEGLLADHHHVIQFTNKGWTIAHPLIERLDGSLFDCDVFWDSDDPGLRGRFNLEYNGETGDWILGVRIEDSDV